MVRTVGVVQHSPWLVRHVAHCEAALHHHHQLRQEAGKTRAVVVLKRWLKRKPAPLLPRPCAVKAPLTEPLDWKGWPMTGARHERHEHPNSKGLVGRRGRVYDWARPPLSRRSHPATSGSPERTATLCRMHRRRWRRRDYGGWVEASVLARLALRRPVEQAQRQNGTDSARGPA